MEKTGPKSAKKPTNQKNQNKSSKKNLTQTTKPLRPPKSSVDLKSRPGEDFINSSEISKKLSSPNVRSADLVYFRRFGDEVEGVLYPPLKSPERFRQRIYPIQQTPGDPGSIVFIPGNKHISQQVDKFNLIGKYVRIKYVAKQDTSHGHLMKIYAIYVNKGFASDAWVSPSEERA